MMKRRDLLKTVGGAAATSAIASKLKGLIVFLDLRRFDSRAAWSIEKPMPPGNVQAATTELSASCDSASPSSDHSPCNGVGRRTRRGRRVGGSDRKLWMAA